MGLPPDTVVLRAGPTWRLLTNLLFGSLLALGLIVLLVGVATFGPPPGADRTDLMALALGAALVAGAFGARALMKGRGPTATFSPAGLEGVGMPVRVAWGDIADARTHTARINRATQYFVEPIMDAAAQERYLGQMSGLSRANARVTGTMLRPTFCIIATGLDRSPAAIEDLIRQYAARYGGTSA